MANTEKITAPGISVAVRDYIAANNTDLSSISVNLLSEKVFTDKKEYTVEISVRPARGETRAAEIPQEAVSYARETADKLLSLMHFSGHKTEAVSENGAAVILLSAGDKDGLLIGKNGMNLAALQYIISMALDARYRRHLPVILDVADYRQRRNTRLYELAKTLRLRALENPPEALTEALPSHERKIIHEELSSSGDVKTFSVGRGPYKKVVVTSLL